MPLLEAIKKCKVEEREVSQQMNCGDKPIPDAHESRPNKLMYRWKLQIKSSSCKNQPFHFEELLQSIQSITDEDILLRLPSVDFMVLRSHEERTYPQKLKIMLIDPSSRVHDHEVDDLNTNMHGLLLQLELFSHLQQPTQKNCSHLSVNSQFSSLGYLQLQPSYVGLVKPLHVCQNGWEVWFHCTWKRSTLYDGLVVHLL